MYTKTTEPKKLYEKTIQNQNGYPKDYTEPKGLYEKTIPNQNDYTNFSGAV